MSAPASEEPEEPDLTAMLDLVLQLVMFFLAVARIDNEQKDEVVILPQATLARALSKDYTKLIVINLVPAKIEVQDGVPVKRRMEKAEVEALTGPVRELTYSVFEGYYTKEIPVLGDVQTALKTKIEADQRATSAAEWAEGKGRSLVVVRAHKNCTFKQVYDLMFTARQAGYTDVQLRAFLPNNPR